MDQAPSQYTNKTAFRYLGQSKISAMRNFYGVRHGKSPCNACMGTVKQGITKLVKSGTEFVNLEVAFCDIAKKHLETDPVQFLTSVNIFFKHFTLQLNCNKGPLHISGQQ